MAEQISILETSQPKNELSEIANAERGKLYPRNDFSPVSESYSTTHPDAMADGDEIGRGTAGFLDIYNQNAGTSTDIKERKDDVKLNRYNDNNPYHIPGSETENLNPLATV